jgi:thiol-disulfide isomerase/thioredoxin
MRNFNSFETQTTPPGSSRRSRLRRRLPSLLLLGLSLLLGLPLLLGAQRLAAHRGEDRLSDRDFRWELRTLDGDPVTLDRFRGRVLFVNLWATWCPPCVAELRSIQALADSLAGEPAVAFLLVSPEAARPVARFVRRRALTAPVYLEGTRAPARFGAFALPTTVVVDRQGRIVLRRRGAADWDDPAIRALLRELAR